MNLFKRKKKDLVVETLKETQGDKYYQGLKKSRENLIVKILKLATNNRKIDDVYFKELEKILISADVGAKFTMSLIEILKEKVKLKNIQDHDEIKKIIIDTLLKNYSNNLDELQQLNIVDNKLNVFLIAGVNGVGKTTSIGKLVKWLIENKNKKILLAAADTFRLGAVEQLKIWAERNKISIVAPKKENQDPASVVFEAIETSKKDDIDILIIDTAGRLQNKEGLMREIEKIKKIITRETGNLPIESLLVLDATTGQNGISQASIFNDFLSLTGIILTKMDSSSKGGIILSIKNSFNVPVKFIGFGEGIDDLQEFNIEKYLKNLF